MLAAKSIYNAVKSAKEREDDTPRPFGVPLSRGDLLG
jgi:hypothetical protein